MSFSFLFLWLHVFPSLKADEGEKIEKKTLRQKKKKKKPARKLKKYMSEGKSERKGPIFSDQAEALRGMH